MLKNLKPISKRLSLTLVLTYLLINFVLVSLSIVREINSSASVMFSLNNDIVANDLRKIDYIISNYTQNSNSNFIRFADHQYGDSKNNLRKFLSINFKIPNFLLQDSEFPRPIVVNISLLSSLLYSNFLFFVLLVILFPILNYMASLLKSNSELAARSIVQEEKFKIARQVAHDIRSPVTALRSALEFMQNLKGEPVYEIIAGSADRINSIAADLMGGNYNRTRDRNLTEEITSLVNQKKVEYPNLSIELQYSDFKNLPNVSVEWIQEVIRMISNLINNSVEASTGNPKVSVVLKQDQISDNINIIISDKSGGMPAEFFDGTNCISTKGVERGLGLTHARQICSRFGWSFKIESEFGIGTCISISIAQSE